MRVVELVIAAGLFAMGARSIVYWIRHPFESSDPRDHLLFATFVVCRVGMWMSSAGYLYLSATLKDPKSGAYLQGRAFTDVFNARYWWYPIIFPACLVGQFLASWFLGHRQERGDPTDTRDVDV